ncbi:MULTISPECIES: roadblock/LC7 domain-containing protein [Deinococcus]|uniref:Roadblock/LC7 n=1 Tax=Deinococcus geothermalis (strain DSM 11300 / CIP 105573 / AG-3a) TaxID=319795 RepID=Q1IZL4_DEIGD|nr:MULTISPECIES: roadblock/LC7 domain-containing protein [Deinococcus]ABF45320.1 Roadblock/LC7 [Deinococcus geothermalis DSM 11300]MBI0444601.1 roadblock/LC7 domain-containing protein [Deinococcus sp. DB0503]TDE86687.1 roadblock/LC7 domain-containing protein [Deinococcus sp. S9]
MIQQLLEVRGIRHVALIDAAGRIVTSAGSGADISVVQAGRAVVGSLKAALGQGEWQDLLLDLEGGPVLLTPHGDQVLLTAFDEVSSLGRIRFSVRRLLG